MYSFDEVIDRRSSDCLKYGVLQARWGRTDLLPLWVADMDFRTPDFIMNALRQRLEDEVVSKHPIVDSLGRTQLATSVNDGAEKELAEQDLEIARA